MRGSTSSSRTPASSICFPVLCAPPRHAQNRCINSNGRIKSNGRVLTAVKYPPPLPVLCTSHSTPRLKPTETPLSKPTAESKPTGEPKAFAPSPVLFVPGSHLISRAAAPGSA
eukprot:2328481-Rhodomonas_salina.1